MQAIIDASLNPILKRGLKRLRAGARPVMVVSHERSGTHFTMNSLAACFGYASLPWISLDSSDFNINFHYAPMLRDALQAVVGLQAANIIKSHHEFGFFADIIGDLKGLDIVYVHRRPADVMSSYWRFVHTWPWNEGPKTATALEFASATPAGQLMRYQQTERATMLDRWAAHVGGWTEAADRYENVHTVRYEDLDADYERALGLLGQSLELQPIRMVRLQAGDPRAPGVRSGPLAAPPEQPPQDRNLIWQLALKRHPLLMRRLGYTYPPHLSAVG